MRYIRSYKLFESLQELTSQDIHIEECSQFDEYKEVTDLLVEETGPRLIKYLTEYCLDPKRKDSDPTWTCYLIYHNEKKIGFIGHYQMFNYIGQRSADEYQGIDTQRLDSQHKYRKPNEYWVGWFGIIPEYRGTIAAKSSIDRLCESIKSINQSADKLLLDTEHDNYRAQKFYNKNGFKLLSTIGEYCSSEGIDRNDHFSSSFKDEDVIFYKDL